MTQPKSIKRAKNPDTPEATSKYYLTNSRLLPAVLKAKEAGALSNELAEMLMMLTRKYAQRPCFSGYTYKEDMISEAMTNLCQNALKFNPDKSKNPFAFYTSCINNSFLQFLNVEKKHRRIRDQLLIDMGENPSYNFIEEHKRAQQGEFEGELNELKTQIEEAKIRQAQEKVAADAKAAELAALAASLLAMDDVTEEVIALDISDEVVEDEIASDDPDLPPPSLLDFDDK